MVNKAAPKSHYQIEKPLTSAAPRTSVSPSQQYKNYSADDIILSLANAYENKRAQQVCEWERVQVTRWQRAA